MKHNKGRALSWLFSVTGKKKLLILLLAVLQAVQGTTSVFYALFLKNIVNAATDHSSEVFWKWIIFIAVLICFQISLSALIRWLKELSNSIFENLFKQQLLKQLLRKDYLRINAIHSGEWMNRLTNDAVVIANNCVEIFPGLTGMAVKLIAALVMVFVLEPTFACILIPIGVVLVLLSLVFRKTLKIRHKEVQASDGMLRVFLQERIVNMLMIRSFAAEEQTSLSAENKMADHKETRMRRTRLSNLCNFGFGAVMNGLYLLGIGWCGYGILVGTISFGTLTAVTQLIAQIQIPLANITGFVPKYYSMTASAERLMEVDRISEDESQAMRLDEIHALYEEMESFGLTDGSFAYYPMAEKISDISKKNMPLVFQNVSITIRKGEFVAFMGQSGCGKTTLLKLLMCVYEMDAGIRFYTDSCHKKHDLTAVHRRLFAYVPQGNALMNGTIAEIVSFSDSKSDSKRIREALRIACADGFVDELEAGVDTVLGERGAGLSEGQMQRIAIARALYSGSPILLLDEASSALDMETETRLLKKLRELKDITVIIVTHRPAALSICDRVIQFTEDGMVEV